MKNVWLFLSRKMRSLNTALLLFVIGVPVPCARPTSMKGLDLKRIVAAPSA